MRSLCIYTAALLLCICGLVEAQSTPLSLLSNTSVTPSNATANTTTIVRCRAKEVPQGQALWILLILGIGSAVQSPGSVILLGHRGFYRLAPELGVLEALGIVLLIGKGVFQHQEKFSSSLKAVFALRRCTGQGQSWWLAINPDDASNDESDAEEREDVDALKEVIKDLETYNHARLIGSLLTATAFAKACLIHGSVRTLFLAIAYYVPFAIIDLLSWLCLRPGPEPSDTEQETEAISCMRLMGLLDPFQQPANAMHNLHDVPRDQLYATIIDKYGTLVGVPIIKDGTEFHPEIAIDVCNIVLAVFAGLFAVVLVFWPVDVPLFLVFDFTWVQKGKWFIRYLTILPWLLSLEALGLLAYLGLHQWIKYRRTDDEQYPTKHVFDLLPQWFRIENMLVVGYVSLKWILILRMYLTDYTGQNTSKPGWLDWLG